MRHSINTADEIYPGKRELYMKKNQNNEAGQIMLSHGAGGGKSQKLISSVFLGGLDSPELNRLDDAAELEMTDAKLAFSTDTFVVNPVFFPGGNIGSLAVSGTVNDVLMKGAIPRYLSLGVVLEEGFLIDDLKKIVKSIHKTCKAAGVEVVTGDTKVVERGKADGIFINTSGIGDIYPGAKISGMNAKPGNKVIVSGDIGRHGIAVMAERNGLKLTGDITSDAAPLTELVLPLFEKYIANLHVLRDPTRGGTGTTLNEIAESSCVRIEIDENEIPVSDEVLSVCELLGFDPLYLPCEGRFLAIVDNDAADKIVQDIRNHQNGRNAAIIGTIFESDIGEVILNTATGGNRILDMPAGELLPRIC